MEANGGRPRKEMIATKYRSKRGRVRKNKRKKRGGRRMEELTNGAEKAKEETLWWGVGPEKSERKSEGQKEKRGRVQRLRGTPMQASAGRREGEKRATETSYHDAQKASSAWVRVKAVHERQAPPSHPSLGKAVFVSKKN